ncbi:hypothetical protein ANTRET_LOCUS1580 [Anthophora retusa]
MTVIGRKSIFICLLFTLQQCANSVKIGYVDVMELMKLGYDVALDIFETLDLISPKNPESGNNLLFVSRMEKELKSQIDGTARKIDAFQKQMEENLDSVVAKLLNDIPLHGRLDQKMRMMDEFVGQINDLYNIFILYSKATTSYEKYTLEDFAKTCVSSRSGALPDILKSIHRLFVPSSDEVLSRSVLILLANEMREASSQICNENQSLQQLLYNLYTTVTLAEIKGYSMIQFSYKLLRLYNPGTNFTEEMKIVKQQYVTRTSETIRAVKTAMAFAPRQVWKCDPKEHKLDETYTKLTELFQGYIVNEVDLNRDSTCRENCGYYEYTKVHGCYQNLYCDHQRKCKGRVLKCEYIDSDMWICPASRNSDRRYEYVQYENGVTFGRKDTCRAKTVKVSSWWRWLFWHCSYCFCYCDDNHANSDRYFSLREVVSDVANNKVVTGIRFKKVNQIIHMQIQEGELMPHGNINKTTIEWKPVNAFSILDSNVTNSVDYHTLSWEKRGLDLDDYVLDGRYLLTGVKFRMLGSRLNLEARMTPFNFTTGKLTEPIEKSFWISHDKTQRHEIKFKNPDIPTRSPLLTLPDSKEDNYLNFAPSGRNADASQNTIPFVDIQPVEVNPPVAIAGVGVFHKGRPGSGGFVALRLITYDYSPHLQVNVTPTVETVLEARSAT